MIDLSPAEEQQLVLQARKGDAAAFGQLYEHYAGPVFRFLCAHLDERLDAEDLTEEVFLRVWQALPGFTERGVPFGGFLFRVARNALYDHYRRNRGRSLTSLDGDDQDELNAGPIADPAVSVTLQMEHKQLHQTLQRLREDQRQVLSLRFISGLSPEETAQAMGKSTGAVRVLQHRALGALKDLLLKMEQDDEHVSEAERTSARRLPLRRRSGPATQ
jgi:RNA polymerase sigma-70 factor, ECF subfamily